MDRNNNIAHYCPKLYISGSIVYRPKVTNYRNFSPAIVHVIIAYHVQNPGNGYLQQSFSFCDVGALCENGWLTVFVFCFFCVEVLWPSQPNGVMSSTVSLPNHKFTGQA